MKRIFLSIFVLLSICLVSTEVFINSGKCSIDKIAPNAKTHPSERAFHIEEKIILDNIPEDVNKLGIWIPYPVSDGWQRVSDFKISGPFEKRVLTDNKYKNKILFLTPKKNTHYYSPLEITISFGLQRKEYSGPSDKTISEKVLGQFLKPDRLVPINGEIKNVAEKITQGKNGDLEKARAIYDYIIDELTYAKDDPKVCGIGDSLLTLRHKKGICTDYHSLFISLVRSLGIPAKFEIGFRIPADKKDSKINGYHCWAKCYIKGKGWVPVDISEADKYPEKRDYFFGNIDENRIHLTTGRDIKLKYAKNSKSLNYFVYPYAELNGLQFNDMDIQISYKNLKGED